MRKALIAAAATLGLTAAMALPAQAAPMAPHFGGGRGGMHAPAGPDWGYPGRPDRDRGPDRDGRDRFGRGCYDHGRFGRWCHDHDRFGRGR
jgi:hypothetical protein